MAEEAAATDKRDWCSGQNARIASVSEPPSKWHQKHSHPWSSVSTALCEARPYLSCRQILSIIGECHAGDRVVVAASDVTNLFAFLRAIDDNHTSCRIGNVARHSVDSNGRRVCCCNADDALKR